MGAEFISAVGSAVSRRNMPIPTPTSVGISAEPCVLDGGAQKRCQRGKISRRIHFCNRIGNFRPEYADSDADGSDSAGGISATHHKSFKKGRKYLIGPTFCVDFISGPQSALFRRNPPLPTPIPIFSALPPAVGGISATKSSVVRNRRKDPYICSFVRRFHFRRRIGNAAPEQAVPSLLALQLFRKIVFCLRGRNLRGMRM